MASLPPEIQLQRLANAYQLSRATQVAAGLELGRLLGEGPRGVAELARATGTDAAILVRFLRFLAELGIVAELPGDRFAPTPLSERLHLVDNIAQGEEAWAAWGALGESLKSGQPAFAPVHGQPFYEYAAAHPDQEANWQEWNLQQTATLAPALTERLQLQGGETVVDIGGGEGMLLATILRRYPACRGVVFDLPSVVLRAPSLLRAAGVAERCALVAGDALRHVPTGGDLYLVCRVLFNCDDEAASRLIRRCRRAMSRGSRLVVVDLLMPEPGDPKRRALAGADLHHFLLWGAALRSRSQMEALFTGAGLAMSRAESLSEDATGWWILEALPS